MPKALTSEQSRIAGLVAWNFRLIADAESGISLFFCRHGNGILATLSSVVKGQAYITRAVFQPSMTTNEIADTCDDLFIAFGDMIFSPSWKD